MLNEPHFVAKRKHCKYQRQKADSTNRVDLDEVALIKPSHQDLHCLPSNL